MLYDNSRPTGSPLSPYRLPAPAAPSPTPQMAAFNMAPPMEPPVPEQLAQPLPSAPPTKRSRPTIWDKEHISETLARIGAGFFKTQNFGDGLGEAASTIADRTGALKGESAVKTTFGGPNGQFAIQTDAQGNRQISEVPEFAKAVEAERASRNAPKPEDVADRRSRMVYAITQLPPEKRAAAYAGILANPKPFQVDTTGMPAEWSEDYGTLGGMMGLDVNQSLTQERANAVAQDQIRHRGVQEAQGAQRVAQSAARVQQGEARVGLARAAGARAAAKPRSAPPSSRKGYTKPTSRADFDALPSGTRYVAPDNSLRIKP